MILQDKKRGGVEKFGTFDHISAAILGINEQCRLTNLLKNNFLRILTILQSFNLME